ncbi:MAG: serine hydrolase [Patescibacteria group bacterium]|nr:serine hydrolase [Patescibacteria group bacterium]
MKKVYILAVILLVSSFVFVSNRSAIGAPTYHEKSILDNHPSQVELSEVKSVIKPVAKNNEPINLSTRSYLIIDRDTLTPILEKDSFTKLPIASITKLVTALVALDNAKLTDIIEVKKTYSDIPTPQMRLFPTEKISLENVLNGLLIASDNDAGEVIADYIGKGDYKAFVKKMNDKTAEIGMKNSHFSNAIGLDNAENYSTAWDLSILASSALNNKLITNLVQTREKRVTNIDGKIVHYLKTTNELLGDDSIHVLGLKTGSTPEAGGCLIALAKTKNNHEIITVVLGSPDRFGETKKLIEWVENNIGWK